MTRWMKWGIATRLLAALGVFLAIGSEWIASLASGLHASAVLVIGFAMAFVGVSAGRGLFVFRKIYSRLWQEELERIKILRNKR